MRTILIDWINEVQYQYKLEIDTYHMTVSIIDRYLQVISLIHSLSNKHDFINVSFSSPACGRYS